MALKALFLDMDETLCDTSGANKEAAVWLAGEFSARLGKEEAQQLAEHYLQGIYKNISAELKKLYFPIEDEGRYRRQILAHLLHERGLDHAESAMLAQRYVPAFEEQRMLCFRLFPGTEQMLEKLRSQYTLVIITNGPTFSQYPKLEACGVTPMVDHIIVGGDEPDEKPHPDIFAKACRLAQCTPAEALHVGDSYSADIEGAHLAGIRNMWICADLEPAIQKSEDPGCKSDFKADSILKLPEVIDLIAISEA